MGEAAQGHLRAWDPGYGSNFGGIFNALFVDLFRSRELWLRLFRSFRLRGFTSEAGRKWNSDLFSHACWFLRIGCKLKKTVAVWNKGSARVSLFLTIFLWFLLWWLAGYINCCCWICGESGSWLKVRVFS